MNKYQEYIDQHLAEVEKLKNKAISEGYIVDGFSIREKKEKVFVMESYFHGEREHESYGYFRITRQFRILTDDNLNIVRDIRESDKENAKELFLRFWEDNVDNDILAFGGDVVDFGEGCILEDEICWISDSDDFSFNKDAILDVYMNRECGKWNGYMSFFMATPEQYEELLNNEKSVDLEISKCLRY